MIPFREDKCTRCGECFTRCRYLCSPRKAAIADIKQLIAGQEPSSVRRKCTGCMACNSFCPNDAGPYDLILKYWSQRYVARGLPVRAGYLLPHVRPNYRTDVVDTMSEPERQLLSRWKATPPDGEFLYPGCNLLTAPSLFDQRILKPLPVSGDWSLCCGEPFYRLGAFDVVENIARGLSEYYRRARVKKIVFACPACFNMFKSVLPQGFGAKFDFECEYLVTWLFRKMGSGELTLARRLERAVAIHDSCHGRVLGHTIMQSNRELCRRLGLSVIEMKNHHENGLCCGIGPGFQRQMPHDMLLTGWRELREGAATGAQEIATYCAGCYLMMNVVRHLTPARMRGPRICHTLEYLAEAAGEPALRQVEDRSRVIMRKVVRHAFPKIPSTRCFKLVDLEVGLRRGRR